MFQISFAVETEATAWTFSQWLSLFGFINNVASLADATSDLQEQFLNLNSSHNQDVHVSLRQSMLIFVGEVWGWQGKVWFLWSAKTTDLVSILRCRDTESSGVID